MIQQHYIIIFGIAGEPLGNSYSTGVIIDYPGDPIKLHNLICELISRDSIINFNKFIYKHSIRIECLTKVFES